MDFVARVSPGYRSGCAAAGASPQSSSAPNVTGFPGSARFGWCWPSSSRTVKLRLQAFRRSPLGPAIPVIALAVSAPALQRPFATWATGSKPPRGPRSARIHTEKLYFASLSEPPLRPPRTWLTGRSVSRAASNPAVGFGGRYPANPVSEFCDQLVHGHRLRIDLRVLPVAQ